MDEFDVGRLTDFDFETLCKDLFEEILQSRLEIFARGADGGIDLRHVAADDAGETIIQCKHWHKSGPSNLISHMKNEEAVKVRRLRPHRYILATSVDLSVANKSKLSAAVAPHLPVGDIYGLQDILAELRKRPLLVARHLRLWLASTAVLQTMLSKEVLTRSRYLLESLEESLEKYVANPSFERSRAMLEREKLCVIAGVPGIGKTTLAKVLSFSYVRDGYELYEISADISEANQVWNEDAPQIFYYDDFLGQTTLQDKLQKNEDRRLVDLLNRVRRTANKRVVLTTREYILEQARRVYEQLARANFDLLTCVVGLDDYSEEVRAQVLYNHVFYSALPAACKRAFAQASVYEAVLEHPNFLPRILEDTFTVAAEIGASPEATVELLQKNLNDPQQLWGTIFYSHLDEPAVHVLETLLFLRRDAHLLDLQEAWRSYRETKGLVADDRLLADALKLMRGTMVRSGAGTPPLSFQNPSIVDFMREYIATRPRILQDVLKGSVFFEQLERVWVIATGWRGKKLLRQLELIANDLQNSLTFLIYAKRQRVAADRKSSDFCHRVHVCLSVAHRLKLEDLARYVSELVAGSEMAASAADLDEVVDIAVMCRDSPYGFLNDLAIEIAEEAADIITVDVSGWSGARAAVERIERLGDLVSNSYLEDARDAPLAVARNAVEDWYNAGMGAVNPAESSEAREILDYVGEWSDPGIISPNMEYIWDSVEVSQMEGQLDDEHYLAPIYPELSEVELMFSLLADLPD